MRCPARFIAATALAAVSLVPLSVASRAAGAQPALPPALASFLTEEAHATPSEREALLAGNPLVKLLDADPSKEIAVLGAVWVNAPPRLYVEQVKNIEQFERGGGFRITKRISNPPSADDFAALTISDQDFEDLKDCKIGDCVAQARRGRRADAPRRSGLAQAHGAKRTPLPFSAGWPFSTSTAIAKAAMPGWASIATGSIPPSSPTNSGSMIDRLPRLAAELPELTRYLLEYPNATLANSTDFLYWQETQFGLRPTVRISHLVIQDRPDQTVVASKMLYASHYFWTALELRVLLPDPARGPGFWLVTVNRSRSDGLSGFTGRVIRSRVRSEVEDGTRAALTATKTKLESQASRP